MKRKDKKSGVKPKFKLDFKPKPKKTGEETKPWKILKKRTPAETLAYRDVHGDQQLKRQKLGEEQTFTSRHIVCIITGALTAVITWSVYSGFDVRRLQTEADIEASRVIPISEPAPLLPRELKPIQWLNLTLVERDTYIEFGYTHVDLATKVYFTPAEYDIWRDVNNKFDSRTIDNDYFPSIWRYKDGNSFYYAERPSIADAQPEPRDFSIAEYANMRIEPCHDMLVPCLGEEGVCSGRTQQCQSEFEPCLGTPETCHDNPVLCHGEEELSLNWQCYHDKGYFYWDKTYGRYLTVAEFERYNDIKANLEYFIESGEVLRYEGVERAGELTHDWQLYPHIMAYELNVIESETITADAGERFHTPLEFEPVEWANKDLVASNRFSHFRFKYVDRRTGKYYTESEYRVWESVREKMEYREEGYIFWRERSVEHDGFNYYLEPPQHASATQERDAFRAITDIRLMLFNVVPAERFKDWGYPWADTNSISYISEIEYQRWKDVQDRVERGELNVPDEIAQIILRQRYEVTDVIWNAMPVPPQRISPNDSMKHVNGSKIAWAFILGAIMYGILVAVMKRNLAVQNAARTTEDISTHMNDQHIALPEEIQLEYELFADVGAECDPQVSTMISHFALINKGLNKVEMTVRAKEDVYDDDGDIICYKGEALYDADGNLRKELLPMIDEEFGDVLFEVSGNPIEVCKKFDPSKIPYNPDGKNRDKASGNRATWAEVINDTWKLPEYETQRPAGAYLVDTSPVNTMV